MFATKKKLMEMLIVVFFWLISFIRGVLILTCNIFPTNSAAKNNNSEEIHIKEI